MHWNLGRAACRATLLMSESQLQAKWDTRFDETWVTLVPFEVALERLKERNGLTGASHSRASGSL